MRKKLLSIVAVAAVAVAAAWVFNRSSNELALTDVALSNVEALAGGEGTAGLPCMYDPYSWCMWFYPDEIIEARGRFS